MTRVTLILITVVLVAAASWALFGQVDRRAPSFVEPPDLEGFDGGRDPLVGDFEEASADGAFDDWGDSVETDAEAGQRVEVQSDGEGARPGPRVVAFDGTSSAQLVPVVGAEVFYTEYRDAVERNDGAPFAHSAELAVRHGMRGVTDAEGRFALPPVRARMIVAIRHESLFGFRTFSRRHEKEERVPLFLDQTLRLVVIGADGEGIGSVPIAIREKRRNWEQRLVVSSAADGHADVPHFQLHRRRARGNGGSEFLAALKVPLPEAVVADFRDDPLPEEPIELRMPATGIAKVRVIGHDGNPFPNPARVRLRALGRGRDFARRLGEGFDATQTRMGAGIDEIEFPFVGLGLELGVRVRLDDDDFTWESEPTAGPVRAAEVVRIDVPMPDWIGVLAGRLVDDAGEPLAEIEPSFLITGRAGRIEGEVLRTDEAGRFELPFRVREAAPPFALEIRQKADDGLVGATIALESLQVGRRVDLGDVELELAGIVAHGRVVDDRGEPVEGARMRLQRMRDLGGETPRAEWRDESYVEARTGEDGSYVVYGDPPPSRLRLRVSSRAHVDITTPNLVPGAQLDLRMLRTGAVGGDLIVPRWMPRSALQVRLAPAVTEGRSRSARLRPRGRRVGFRFRDVVPGVYDFSVGLRGFREPVVRYDGIRIEPGANALDPRLAGIDLQNSLFRYRLRARASDGQPIGNLGSPLLAKVTKPNGESEFIAFPWRGNRVEIFSASPRMEVVQLGTGFRPKQTFVASGDGELLFERLQPVEIVMPGLRAAVGAGRRVRVSAVLISDTGLPNGMRGRDQRSGNSRSYSRAQLSKSGGAWLGDGDTVRMRLMRDGEYRIVVRLYESGVRGPVSKSIGKRVIRLDPVRSPRIEVPFDQKRIDEALAELGKRKANR